MAKSADTNKGDRLKNYERQAPKSQSSLKTVFNNVVAVGAAIITGVKNMIEAVPGVAKAVKAGYNIPVVRGLTEMPFHVRGSKKEAAVFTASTALGGYLAYATFGGADLGIVGSLLKGAAYIKGSQVGGYVLMRGLSDKGAKAEFNDAAPVKTEADHDIGSDEEAKPAAPVKKAKKKSSVSLDNL